MKLVGVIQCECNGLKTLTELCSNRNEFFEDQVKFNKFSVTKFYDLRLKIQAN